MENKMFSRKALAAVLVVMPVLLLFTNAVQVSDSEKLVQVAMADLDRIDAVISRGGLGVKAVKYLRAQKKILINFIASQKLIANCEGLLPYEPQLENGIYHLYPTREIARPHGVYCESKNGVMTSRVLKELDVTKMAREYKPLVEAKAATVKPVDQNLLNLYKQVRALYLEILEREPDNGGWDAWVGAILDGMSLAQVRQNFLTSPEYKALQLKKKNAALIPGYRNQVRALYLELLGREPDAGGWDAWVNNMLNGMTIAQVRQHFMNSPEYKARQAQLKDATYRAQVRALYLELLKREPDAGGWNGWVANMHNGMSLAQVRQHFINSAEYKALLKKKK